MTMPAQFPALQQRGLAKFIKLALDFSANETLDSRITFSRTSNATRVNAQGLIEYAPHNLFETSENVLNWVPGSGAGITANATISPDGASTADLITGASSLGWAVANTIARQPAATLIPSTTYYGSIYVKAGTATTVTLQLRDQSTGATQQTTVTLTGSWQRISANITLGSATTAIGFILGNANGTFYAWGVQLNIGSLQPYYTTSVKNLLGYSQNFENAAWSKSNSSIDATPVMGPLGFLGAEKLVESAVAGQHYILQNVSIGANGKYTASIYAKKAEKTNLTIWLLNAATADRAAVNVNLINGTYVSAGAGGAPFIDISVNVVNVGDGWFRCGISATTTGGAISLQARYFGNDGSSYTGDGTSGIYIFGAQLSDSASLDPYVYNFGAAPTSSAYYGPRFDYDPVTLAPKGLLIEESRTNLLTYSEQFDNAVWVKTNATVTANATTAPDGTLSADKLVEDIATGYHFATNSASVTSGITYTISIYAKSGEDGFVNIQVGGGLGASLGVATNLNTGAQQGYNGATTYSISNAGNNWWRINLTITAYATGTGIILIATSKTLSINPTYTGDGTSGVYLWGAQLEAGAFPTSYIPTTSAQVTRASDNASMVGTNFSSWYNQSEGTVACESLVTGVRTSDYTYWRIDDNTNTNRIQSGTGASVTVGNAFIITNNISQGNNIVNANPTSITKTAFAIATNNTVNSANGVIGTVDTTASLPTVNQLVLGRDSTAGYINGYINSFKYFNKRLLNSYLQSLTQ